MKLRKLKRTHAEYDAATLAKYGDLFSGGEKFAKNVASYLTRHEQEPERLYATRCRVAADEYINYSAGIINYYAAWLFTSQLTYKTDPESVDEFYETFKENCDGKGKEFDNFLHHMFVDACRDGCMYFRVEFPEAPPADAAPQTLADWQRAGAGRAVLRPVHSSAIINWKCDDNGYMWLTEYEKTVGLLEPDDEEETTTETWTIWRRDGEHQRFEASYTKRNKPTDSTEIPEVDPPNSQGQIKGIPFVEIELPREMHVMGIIAAPQLANFRKRAALSWAIDRNCYVTPVFKLKNKRKPPTMGTGYYVMIGIDEDVEFPGPTAAPFAVIREFVTELKDEIHRVSQQMARGVDNNAAAVGRSGESKQADDMATEIVLGRFGKILRHAAKVTMDLIAEGRGEKIITTVGGMESYHVTDADSFSKMALAAQGMSIPSATHHRLVAKRQSALMLPDIDEQDRQTINKEIDAGITPESLKAEKESEEDTP